MLEWKSTMKYFPNPDIVEVWQTAVAGICTLRIISRDGGDTWFCTPHPNARTRYLTLLEARREAVRQAKIQLVKDRKAIDESLAILKRWGADCSRDAIGPEVAPRGEGEVPDRFANQMAGSRRDP